jgi:hypothetical protein
MDYSVRRNTRGVSLAGSLIDERSLYSVVGLPVMTAMLAALRQQALRRGARTDNSP